MKRIAGILALSLYLISITGVAVKLHYCGEELSAVIFSGADADCGCDEGCEDDGCCHDQNYFFKVKTDHVSAANTKQSDPIQSVAILPVSFPRLNPCTLSDVDSKHINVHGPPVTSKYRTHLLIGRFTC